jgi:hypothetical protein
VGHVSLTQKHRSKIQLTEIFLYVNETNETKINWNSKYEYFPEYLFLTKQEEEEDEEDNEEEEYF